MILKLLLVIGVIYAVYFFFIKKKPQVQGGSKNATRDKAEPNEMVECASCGVYCELEEAILSNARYYCSQECVNRAG